MAESALQAWLRQRGVSHAHCPLGCPKPQPTVLPDGRCVCLRCWVYGEVLSEMVPCTPETCD